MPNMKPYPEAHAQGLVSFGDDFEQREFVGDIGLQIAADGRIWVCVDGINVLRFKPLNKAEIKRLTWVHCVIDGKGQNRIKEEKPSNHK